MRSILRSMAHLVKHRINLPRRTGPLANDEFVKKAYNSPSPNEMVVDTSDYVDVDTENEKEPVAIINPDNLGQDELQIDDEKPLANDCTRAPVPLQLRPRFADLV